MPIGDRFIHSLVIERLVAQVDGSGSPILDADRQPVSDQVELASVSGLVQPRRVTELLPTDQAEAVRADHVIYLFPTDLEAGDFVFFADDGSRRYEVLGVRDAAGLSHHLEVDARLVSGRRDPTVSGS